MNGPAPSVAPRRRSDRRRTDDPPG